MTEQNPLKTIFKDEFQDKFYNGVLNGSILSVLLEIIEFAEGIIIDLEKDGESPSVACRNECCFCCYSHLRVIPVEALLILSFIKTHFGEKRLFQLKKKMDRSHLLTQRKTIEERFQIKGKTPCVFLEEGSCSIYPVRPFICRSWNSLDRTECESAFYADSYHAEIETSSARNFVFGSAREMFVELSRQVNLQSSELEMFQAVFKCMNIDDPVALWLAGYPILDTEPDLKKVDHSITKFHRENETAGMTRESGYVDYFYEKYQGRVAIGGGQDKDHSAIYPFVFQDAYGAPLGIVSMGVVSGQKEVVRIYHIGSFMTRKGDGSLMLKELCRKADCFDIRLTVSPVYMPNGKDPRMNYERLSKWYNRFDFKGDSNLTRPPRKEQGGVY